jgi:UDP-GlcNAc:undecaprenyl-phosphate/decaprenyl-phosphate GlcNAc-1-phosphate transferase
MRTYLALFLAAATASLVLTPLLRRFCQRYGLLDEPVDDRRVHERGVPRLGGVAIFLSVLISLSTLPLLNNLLTQSLRPELKQIAVFLGCGLLVLILGAYDDLFGASAVVKFAGLALVATLWYASGGRIEALSVPFLGGIPLNPIAGFILTLVWIVGIANAFNLIDGIDGLASGSALFSSLVLLILSLIHGRVMVTAIALVLTGALAGFLRYNFNPASIFLGDSGSLFVGFALAALSLEGSQKASTAVAIAIPIVAFGLPVVDTSVAIARRFVSGKPIFEADKEHIHHMLLARGWSPRRVVLVLYGASALFGLLSMLFVNSSSGTTAVVLFVVGGVVALALGKLRYHEIDELRASFKRNIGDRRARATNNLRLRRACQSVRAAANGDEFFNGVLEILELGDFAYATVQLASWNGFQLSAGNRLVRNVTVEQGQLRWSWKHDDFRNLDVVGSSEFWTLRLPLASSGVVIGSVDLYRPLNAVAPKFDVNYLAAVFQPALVEGAERIFYSQPKQRAAAAN